MIDEVFEELKHLHGKMMRAPFAGQHRSGGRHQQRVRAERKLIERKSLDVKVAGNKVMKKIIFLFFGLLLQIYAYAGWVEGPHLIWFNLNKSPAIMDTILADCIKSDPPICWDDGLMLFMHAKPTAVTRELSYSAIILRNKNTIASLNNLMKLPFDDATDGFDGIVVYADEPESVLYSLTTGKKKIQRDVVAKPVHIKGAFCNVIPATVRKP